MGPVGLSLTVAAAATLLGLGPATACGWALARHEFRGKALVTSLVLAPLVLPPVVTGLLLLWALGRQSVLGGALASVGLPVPFTWGGAVLAACVVGFPLHVLTARSAFEAVDPRFEAVSLTLGVSRARTWRRITLPLAMPGLAAGTVLAFARSLGEFGATVILAGNVEGRTRTIALAVYTLLDRPDGDAAVIPLVGASLTMSAAALLGYEALIRWQRRRLERDHG